MAFLKGHYHHIASVTVLMASVQGPPRGGVVVPSQGELQKLQIRLRAHQNQET